jgi:ABC-type glycerol-3-phosphate transport system permease component
VFFLGPFFWIVTTSLKGNEDFLRSRRCGSRGAVAQALRRLVHALERGAVLHEQPGALDAQHDFRAGRQPAHGVFDRRWRFGVGPVDLPARAAHAAGHRPHHPIYIVYKLLGITNNYLALVVIYTVLYIPFSVWLLVGFLRDFPVRSRRRR